MSHVARISFASDLPRDMVRERARRSDDDDLGSSSRASLLPNYRSEEKKEHNEPEKR